MGSLSILLFHRVYAYIYCEKYLPFKADRQQASIVFEVAADMVRMCPALNKRVKILASQKHIVYLPTNSFY